MARNRRCLCLVAGLLAGLPGLLAGAHAASDGDALRLTVLDLQPEANYEPTRDPEDRAQLTDGRLNPFPFWTRRESVGWVNRTPVRITAEATLQAGSAYTLGIRAAMDTGAGVFPPRRVDVYCQPRGKPDWQHAGALTHARDPAEERRIVDLAVPFTACSGQRLQVLLQADGPFVLIDELSLAQAPAAAAAGNAAAADPAVTDPGADSRRRLESGLREAGQATLRKAVRERVTVATSAWLASPWGELAVPTPGAALTRLKFPVVKDGEASVVLGIANPRPAAHRYTVGLPTGMQASARVARLLPVLAADGQLAFDPVEARDARSFDLEAGGLLYLLVTERGVGQSGTRRIDVADDTGWQAALDVDIEVLDRIRPEPADQPRVLVWTYTNDRPIWRPETAAAVAAGLAAAGVNVIDIHPAHIPAPLREADWPARTAALKSDLALFRGKALALLFLGGEPWDTLVALPDDAASQRRLARWVSTVTATMKDSGYGTDDWALYLIDEPRGDDLARLASLITRLRAIDPTLRFYANPSLGRGEQVTALPALWKLKGLVDWWQPRAGASFDAVATVLGKSAGERLWVYDNPREPARSATPACYRALGQRAFDAGARGLGFWSFSSTNDSSAWSDFDGQQPDWAVAYEADSGYVPGRRWEAFRQGVRDFAALSYCARSAAGDAVVGAQCSAYRNALAAGSRGGCGQW
jgi:hypothetical protein